MGSTAFIPYTGLKGVVLVDDLKTTLYAQSADYNSISQSLSWWWLQAL